MKAARFSSFLLLAHFAWFLSHLPAFLSLNDLSFNPLMTGLACWYFLALHYFFWVLLALGFKNQGPKIFFSSLLSFYLILDFRLYLFQGVHLYEPIVLNSLFHPMANREFQISFATFIGIILIFIFLMFLHFVASKIQWIQLQLSYKKIFILSFLSILGIIATNLYYYIDPRIDAILLFKQFHLPIVVAPPENSKRPIRELIEIGEKENLKQSPNILLLAAESFRADYFTSTLFPKTKEWLKNFEKQCFVSPQHFSGGHTTDYGIFSLLYGVPATYYYRYQGEKKGPLTLKALAEKNYYLWGRSSSHLTGWNNARFIFSSFDDYQEILGDSIEEDDKKVLLEAKKFLETPSSLSTESIQSKFMFLFFNASHYPYHYPEEFEQHSTSLKKGFNPAKVALAPYLYRKHLNNRYKNALFYLDSLWSSLLKEIDLEKTVLLITGDHGESFWELGAASGHAKSNFVKSATQTPLWICGPQETIHFFKQNFSEIKTTHEDVLPALITSLSGQSSYPLSPQFMIAGHNYPEEGSKMAVVSRTDPAYEPLAFLVSHQKHIPYFPLQSLGKSSFSPLFFLDELAFK